LRSEYGSSNNDVSSNNFFDNQCGATIEDGDNNVVSQNIIADSYNYGTGLSIDGQNCTVFANTVTNNYRGFSLHTAGTCVFFENNISGSFYGVCIDSTIGAKLFHNNLNNTNQILTYRVYANNSWDNGYPSAGNFWSTYNGTDQNGDGIGDTPYSIAEGNVDNYPLMTPFNIRVTVPPPPTTYMPPQTAPTESPTQTSTPAPTDSPIDSPTPAETPVLSSSPSSTPTNEVTPTPTQTETPNPITETPPTGMMTQPLLTDEARGGGFTDAPITVGIVLAASVAAAGAAVATSKLLLLRRKKP
jgi:parallel beta-helix repeat protein